MSAAEKGAETSRAGGEGGQFKTKSRVTRQNVATSNKDEDEKPAKRRANTPPQPAKRRANTPPQPAKRRANTPPQPAKRRANTPPRPTLKKHKTATIQNTIFNYFQKSPEKKSTPRPKPAGPSSSSQTIIRRKYRYTKTSGQRDAAEYRRGYPSRPVRNRPELRDNLLFYTNKIPSKPRGGYIDEILESWWGDYKLLELHHGYIQWLFPIRESGMNSMSQELQPHEAQSIESDGKAQARLIKAYSLMLDFYGMKLKDKTTGELERSSHWRARYKNLNDNRHNYLRITRMLKSLGELGREQLKAPFVKFILHEALVERALLPALDSAIDYWIATIKDDTDRQKLTEYAYRYIEEV